MESVRLLGTPDYLEVDPATGNLVPDRSWSEGLSAREVQEVLDAGGDVEFTVDARGRSRVRRDADGNLIGPGVGGLSFLTRTWQGLPLWAWGIGALFVWKAAK